MGLTQSCRNKKVTKIVHSNAFDLIDTDGDYKLSEEEIRSVSKVIHNHHLAIQQQYLDKLKTNDGTEYVYNLLGKKLGDKLTKKDFKRLACSISTETWIQQILPVLREKEITRLQNSKYTYNK
tara:strand:+ start:57 stop:425 length:369 start_codon:yes stop_codon:yes gene_type:complete